jgi:hypothetical protein
MTKMSPLLEHNRQFAAAYTPGPLGPPAAQVVIVTCLDHLVDRSLGRDDDEPHRTREPGPGRHWARPGWF